MVVMCACVVLVVGLVAAINLAVPLLAASPLHPSGAALLWVVDLYVIVFATLVIPGGAAGDRFGRKGVLLSGLLVLALGAAVSAAAPDVPVLLAGRALSGAGAAAVLPNTLAVLLHAVPATRKPATIATWASMTGIGGVVGNVGGGALLTTGSWRWLFVAAVALALALAGAAAALAPVSSRHDRSLSPLGTTLLVAASIALLVGIVQGPQQGWHSTTVIGGFTGSAVLFTAWVLVELRADSPLLDPRLFASPKLRSACAGMVTFFFGVFALFYVNASFLQYGKGFSVLATGFGIVPVTVPIIAGGRHVGRLSRRIGVDATLSLGFGLAGAGLLAISTSRSSTSYLAYAGWLVVLGIGFTLALPTLSGAIATSLPAAQAGVGAGLQATTRELGSALGVAVIGSVLTARFVAALPPSVRDEPAHPHTVAAALASSPPAESHAIISAFISGADLGLRVVGVAVLALGCSVLAESALSRRRTRSSAANRPATGPVAQT